MPLPQRIENLEQLEELLSRPTGPVVELFRRLEGDVVILGAGGKIGPSLTRMACRARQQAARGRRIIAVARFSDSAARAAIEQVGAEVLRADLMDPAAVAALPPAQNVLYLVGQKFGTTHRPDLTWAVNTLVPAAVAQRYRLSRIVAFSTGCVYPLVPAGSRGSTEADELTPLGEYANACVARERIFEHASRRDGTPVVQLRLNYALELRYGVLVDLARQVLAGEAVDLTMGYFNAVWQGDVNAAALRLLEHAASPPAAFNVTGPERLSVRQVAAALAARLGRPARFAGQEAPTALLADASRAIALLGPPMVPIERVIDWTADWLARGGATLNKPTHFQQRDGRY